MRDLFEAATQITDFESAKNVFLSAFGQASAAGRLPDFRAACLVLLRNPPHPACIPYAFAYEARGLLHDPLLWLTPDESGDSRASPELLLCLSTCLQRPEAINCRDNYYWLVISGLFEFVSGNVSAAFRQLALASTYPDFYRVVRCDLGGGAAFAKTYPTLRELDACRAGPRFQRDAHFVMAFDRNPGLVISVSFDVLYCQAFGADWIRKVASLQTADIGLHFHVMFVDAANTEILAALRAEAQALGVLLAISIDWNIRHGRAYFASARFIKGASLLRAFQCPLIQVDADAYLTDAQMFLERHLPRIRAETRILGLLADGPWDGYLPWRRFSATWLLSPTGPAAEAFLMRVADCIEYFWDARGNNWWIDQMGLEVGRRSVTEESASPPQFGQIYTELPDLFETGEDYKIAQISKLPEMQRRMSGGKTYWEALYDVSGP